MIVASPAPATSPVSAPSPPVLPPSRPPGLVSRLPGIPDTVATARDFPPRYRRRVLADEEMEYIQVSAWGAVLVFCVFNMEIVNNLANIASSLFSARGRTIITFAFYID